MRATGSSQRRAKHIRHKDTRYGHSSRSTLPLHAAHSPSQSIHQMPTLTLEQLRKRLPRLTHPPFPHPFNEPAKIQYLLQPMPQTVAALLLQLQVLLQPLFFLLLPASVVPQPKPPITAGPPWPLKLRLYSTHHQPAAPTAMSGATPCPQYIQGALCP
jgi:hypothetical protein